MRKRFAIAGIGVFLVVVVLLAGVWWRRRVPITPDRNTVFTSTRCVTALGLAPEGTLWVGTRGGVLRRSQSGAWEKFTCAEGLPAHEAQRLNLQKSESVTVAFPQGAVTWRKGGWQPEPNPPHNPPLFAGQTCATYWRNGACVATLQGLHLQEGKTWRVVPLPKSKGSHISALWPYRDVVWAALFGDGLWSFNGEDWTPLNIGLPPQAREITALARDNNTIWIGTRRAGVWACRGKQWTQYLQPDEPVDHNCQAIAMFDGNLFVSTLEDGLAVRTSRGWGHYQEGTIASNAPRQMVAFRNVLYLRHGNGKMDTFDGKRWQRNVCAGLPHKQVSALAADSKRLYVAQWGGWSEFDGTTWTHHLDLPELQGVPVTALCPDAETLWIGTQGRGVAEFDHATGALRWHDERSGLPDDWVTVMERVNGTLTVGTFVGGLAKREGARWTPYLNGENVTALAPDGSGGLFVATRNGVWHSQRDGALAPVPPSARCPLSEAQTLCKVAGGLWIGTRTGLFFRTDTSLRPLTPRP